jgi:diguanylate cyclase (GGDEF)-like protein/PAS domain S-box-containing protein
MPPAVPALLSSAADLDTLRAVLDLIDDPILVKDRQHRFVLVNRAGCTLLGRSGDEIVGRTDHDLQPREQADIYIANDRRVLETGQPNTNEELLTDGGGDRRTLITRKSRLRLANGQDFVLVHISDITDFRRAEAQVLFSAERDGLTGLANIASLRQELNALLAQASGEGQRTALLVLDLDRFGQINHALGRTVGDNLLVQFGRLLSQVTRPGDLIGRLGGDEFVIVQTASGQPVDADALAATILRRLESPLFFETRRVHLSTSIGIAIAGQGENVESLLRRAELALGQAKREGRSQRRFFEAEMARRAVGPFLEDDLRVALQQKQFSLVYQPYARVADLGLLGYEALLRWNHPDLGEISPSAFIPLAESEGFIVAIGEWVLHEACRHAARGPKELALSVNVSPIQFTRADLVSLVRSAVKETGIEPERLELEITETAVIGDIKQAQHILAELRAIGVRVALDDFGAGYSSLEVLQALPFNKIKIDRSLVRDAGQTEKADAIISAILRLTQTLRLRAVAEGVETLQQLELLRRERCDEFQGFFLSPPVSNPFASADLAG